MESIQSKLSVSAMTANFGIFKEPRGFIRLLQFIFAILAFATACNGSSSLLIKVNASNVTVAASWSYPYNLKNTPIEVSSIPTSAITLSTANDVKPSAEFFLFTGVTAMLLSFAFCVIYVLMDQQYRNNQRLPLVDLALTLIWSIFWIAGSSAWGQGVSNIRAQTQWEKVASRTDVCSVTTNCKPDYTGTYANVIVSVIFGFLNFILWVGSAWFIYKETRLFKGRAPQEQPQIPPSNFSNISTSSLPQPTIR